MTYVIHAFPFILAGGIICVSCPHRIVYGTKSVLRSESVRDHMDLLMSLKRFPVVVISDLSSMLAAHGEKRMPGLFKPFKGRLAAPTASHIQAAKDGDLAVHLPSLECEDIADEVARYSLSDKFHQGNLSNPQDLLRRVSLVPQLTGLLNTQVQEQLFSKLGKDAYFLTQMTPAHHVFMMRLIVHLHNRGRNRALLKGVQKTVSQSSIGGQVRLVDEVVHVQPLVCYASKMIGILFSIDTHTFYSR